MSKDKNSRRQELCIRDELGFIVAWQVGMSEDDIRDMLKRHPGWRRGVACVEEP